MKPSNTIRLYCKLKLRQRVRNVGVHSHLAFNHQKLVADFAVEVILAKDITNALWVCSRFKR